ncbi:MAG: hypothetical protein ACI8WB_004631, partial [Phenylobacterium sp.]
MCLKEGSILMKIALTSATVLILALTGCAGSDYKNNINSDKSVKIRSMAKANNLK